MLGAFAKTIATAILASTIGAWTATVRTELEVAKVEIRFKMRSIAAGGALIALGAFFGLLGVMLLLTAAVLGLSTVWQPWVAALVVGVVVLATTAILVSIGSAKVAKNKDIVPHRQIENIKKSFGAS